MITTLYEKLSSRKYKEFTTCQYPDCSNPLKKTKQQKVAKYCCEEHAKKAQLWYIKEWKKRNKDHIKLWNQRYVRKRRKRINDGEIPDPNYKKNEDQTTQAD